MALIQYKGTENVVVTLNGERKLIKPNKIFSGPESFKTYDNFEIIGLSKQEKKETKSLSSKNLKLEIKKKFVPKFDISFLNENGFPKVSICIVTKDSNGIIQRCIESINEFNKYENYEILICDTGTTQKNVLEYYKKIECNKIKIFLNNKYNFSKNNNFLVTKSSGDVILFMNNDVFLTYDAISEMVKYILCSNMGCVGHRLVWDKAQDEIQHDGQILYDNNGSWIGPGHHNFKLKVSSVSNENKRVEGVTAAFLMIRKTLFNEVKGFDENYKDIYQDVDLNLKVRKAGYDNFVIRKHSILHIDHATRVNDFTTDSPLDVKKFYNDWRSKGLFPVNSYKKYSIVVCATNKKQLKTLFESIQTREEYELIFLNNSLNYLWSSEALNILTEVSEGEIIFYMHQDVTFDAYEPFATTMDIINKIGGQYGILGPAGVQVGGKGSIRGVDFSSMKYNFDFLRAQTLDEFCLITNRKNKLIFGEYLDHFHFYGADICCQALIRELNNYIIKIPITHHSGGDVNLKKRGGYEAYLKQGKKFLKKWKDIFPYIVTTTMQYGKGHVFWCLGFVLGLEPNREDIDFDNIDETPNKKHYIQKNIEPFLNKKPNGVSIVILNKDKPEYIIKCISLLKKYIIDKNIEIIIGDTGTTDKKVLDFYETIKENCNIIRIGKYHFSKNNNTIVKKYVKYNKVLFMNNAVFINNDIVSNMVLKLQNKIGIVGAKLLYENGNIQHIGIKMIRSKEKNPNQWFSPEHIDYKKKNYETESKKVDCVTGAFLLVATDLFLEFDGFDEKFDTVFQDIDFCLKVRRDGYKTICYNEDYAIHIESGTRNPKINDNDYNLLTERWGKVKY